MAGAEEESLDEFILVPYGGGVPQIQEGCVHERTEEPYDE